MNWQDLISNLGSKKLLATIAGMFGLANVPDLDGQMQAYGVIAIAVAYLVAQGFADGMSKKYGSGTP